MDANDIPKTAFRAPKNNRDNSDLIKICSLTQNTTDGDNIYCHLPPLNAMLLKENCSKPGTYDYMNKSQVSYILTFVGIGTFVIGNNHTLS